MPRRRTVTKELESELQAYYDGCGSLRETARAMGVPYTTVEMYVQHDGIKKLSLADIDRACDLYTDCGSFKVVAKAMGWGPQKAWNVLYHERLLKEYDETRDDDRICELFARWGTVKAVAEILGCGRQKVDRVLDRKGIERRRHKCRT